MLLPSLARLAVTPTGVEAEDLPPDLVALIQVLVHSDDPCRELVNQCMINKRWAVPCRDGTIYEATNRRMGWYGAHGSLAAVQQHYRANPNPTWAPPDTAKDYFLQACADLHRLQTQNITMVQNPELSDSFIRRMGWYGTHGSLEAVQQHYLDHPDPMGWTPPATAQEYAAQAYADMRRVETHGLWGMPGTAHWHLPGIGPWQVGNAGVGPTPRPWFTAMVKVAIRQTWRGAAYHAILQVPPNHPDYGELAQLACDVDASNFMVVFGSAPNYLAIALHVVPGNPSLLLPRVLGQRPDVYYEVARATVARDADALRFVEGSLAMSARTSEPIGANGPLPLLRALSPAAYVEIATVAVEQNPDALRWVHPGWPGYERIAIRMRRARNIAQRQLAGP